MATLDVTADVEGARALLKNYQKRKLPTAARRSLNTALRGGRTDSARQLKTRITMKVGKISERVKLTQSAGNTFPIKGVLEIVGPSRTKEFSNLGSFQIKVPEKSIKGKRRLKGKGVRAKVYGERKLKTYRGTFAWTRPGKSGEAVTVFKRVRGASKRIPRDRKGVNKDGTTSVRSIKRGPRKGQTIKRQPIKAVWGTSLKREFVRRNRLGEKPVIDLVTASMRVRFIKEFNRLLARL